MSIDADAYCRDVETYLCRKNEGHLIRIVGPSFELVSGWAATGVPLKVVFSGIDRYCDRYYAKGPRRRPVRIDFCDPDVLDVFDEWRRAVGMFASPTTVHESRASGFGDPRRRFGLAGHLDGVIARLTALRATPAFGQEFDERLETAVRALDGLRPTVRGARGERRERILQQLEALDRELLDAARQQVTADALETMRQEAAEELAAFRERMSADALAHAMAACIDRLVREQLHLPRLVLD